MKQLIKDIINDIRSGKNLDLYTSIVVCSIVVVLSIIPKSKLPTSVISAAILAVLLVLLARTLDSRHILHNIKLGLEKCETTIKRCSSSSATEIFFEWNDFKLASKIKTAQEVAILAVSPNVFLDVNSESLRNLVVRGGMLKCIFVDPNCENFEMAAYRMFGIESDNPKVLRGEINNCIERIREIARNAPNTENVQLKLISCLPCSIVTIINGDNQDGIIYVTDIGFQQPCQRRPSFELRRKVDTKWFSYYSEQFEKLWNCHHSNRVDLNTKSE
jgi:hypothetical protein